MTRSRRERLRATLKTAMMEYEDALETYEVGFEFLRKFVKDKHAALNSARWPEMTWREYEAMATEVLAERQARREAR